MQSTLRRETEQKGGEAPPVVALVPNRPVPPAAESPSCEPGQHYSLH
jgi:hypothetical protein